MTDFNERFKNYKNSALLKIINSRGEYELLAVAAAKNIFESRRLTDEEIEIAKAELANQQLEKDALDQKKINITNKVKDFGSSVADILDPVQTTPPTANKIIKVVSIAFGLLFLYMLAEEFSMIKYMFTNIYAEWDFITALYFLPLLWILTATILFYIRKKSGWILLTAFITYSIGSSIFGIFIALNSKPSGIPAFDNLLVTVSPVTVIATLLFFGGSLWMICKNEIREIYKIDNTKMIRTIVISGVLTVVLFFKLMMM